MHNTDKAVARQHLVVVPRSGIPVIQSNPISDMTSSNEVSGGAFWHIPCVCVPIMHWCRIVLGALRFDRRRAMPRGARQKGGEDRDLKMERMFAVAVRDEGDLFLWIRIRRAKLGDIYYAFPIGRSERDWQQWNPHGSHHKDGRRHHKSFDKKIFPAQRQKPDSDFKGSETLITRPIATHEPRTFGVICDPAKFSEVMEMPSSILSSKKYETYISIDLAEPHSPPILTALGEVVAQRAFSDAAPWIWVTVTNNPWPQNGTS